MLTLAQSMRAAAEQGHGIIPPYYSMAHDGFTFRRGQMSMIAAAPGGGKSAIAQDIAVKAEARTLYLSADTDPYTMAIRTIAKATSTPQRAVEQALRANSDSTFLSALESSPHVRYSFDIADITDCGDEVAAYLAVMGDYPELVIVDNLTNVQSGEDGDYAAMRAALDKLHRLARNTEAHVMVLHHVTGEYQAGDRAIPLRGIQNKVSESPAQILTLYRSGDSVFLCPVKHRDGNASAAGTYQYRVHCDLSTMIFSDTPIHYGGQQ